MENYLCSIVPRIQQITLIFFSGPFTHNWIPERIQVPKPCSCPETVNFIDDNDRRRIAASCMQHCQNPNRLRLSYLNDWTIERMLECYLLTFEEIKVGGFPLDCSTPGSAMIWKEEFNPGKKQSDLWTPPPSPVEIHDHEKQQDTCPLLRMCRRCSFSFPVARETGEYLLPEKCQFHPGKQQQRVWQCCGATGGDMSGCRSAKGHVWTGVTPGLNGPLPGFMQTRSLGLQHVDNFGVFAIDCEMAWTTVGMSLIRISVVRVDGCLVYDEFVKPEEDVIDYGTEIHGITEKEVAKASKVLLDVQNDLLEFIHAESILVGHGLDNDLRVLKIIHKRVIDTSYLFPHEKGFPFRHSLKALAKNFLQKDIQIDRHCPIEDARVAMDVMLFKLNDDLNKRAM